jgi:hypothetical protein
LLQQVRSYNWLVILRINPLTPELNPTTQRCLPDFLLGIVISKGLNARRLYKSLGFKGLTNYYSMAAKHG